jgi:LytS/YehU family sensor histidine kinase
LIYWFYRSFDLQKYLGLQHAFILVLVPMSFNIISSYVHYFFILPPWIRQKKTFLYLAKLMLLLVCVIPLRMIVEKEILTFKMVEEYYGRITWSRVVNEVWDTMVFILFTGMIRFTLDWFDLENKKKQLENEKLIAELNYLKAQINPHFLFNTLHNLNYLVYAKSEKATDVIIKLSNIMRYMIYDASKDKVMLKKEIEYMHDYIHLEKIRLNHAFQIDFMVEGNISDREIAPLVFITFLENAFKHGVSDLEANCWIKVRIRSYPGELIYEVTNRKLKSNHNVKLKSGFGLENLRKRLDLGYAGLHQLTISDNEDIFYVNLTLTQV